MNSIVDSTVIIQTVSHSVASTPSWFGEMVLLIEHLRKQGVLSTLSERVRFVVNDLNVRQNQPQCLNFAFKVRSIQNFRGSCRS